jgi:CheY-like chemotaxis protein
MVYGIMRNHGGQVTVASQPGAGSAMRLYLPALERAVTAPSADATPQDLQDLQDQPVQSVQSVQQGQPVNQGAETIMVVDDEEFLCELAREILIPMGYRVITASNGIEALSLFDREPVNLVVLDIVMPRMGGKETFIQLRKRDAALPVVVSSGFSRHGQAHDLMEMGANAFVQKPYRPKDLAQVIRETLDQAKRSHDKALHNA